MEFYRKKVWYICVKISGHVSFITGSLLIGRNPEEVDVLKRHVELLQDAGLRSEYLSATDLLSKEPALMVDKDSGAAFLPDDCQLDARRTVDIILKVFFWPNFFPLEIIWYIIIFCSCNYFILYTLFVVYPHNGYGSYLG